jgi:septation ring formation regulator EzrA
MGTMDQDLLDYLKQSFSAIDERFSEISKRFTKIDQRFDAMDQRFENLETQVRKVQVVVEDLRDKVQLTAEGIMTSTRNWTGTRKRSPGNSTTSNP